jgi:hypothetical protein
MYVARLICSDESCAERVAAEADDLLELLSLACECGCTFEILGLPDWIDDDAGGRIVEFRPRRTGAASGRLAA